MLHPLLSAIRVSVLGAAVPILVLAGEQLGSATSAGQGGQLTRTEEQCADLLAEKTIRVGRVCVTERSDTLLIRFAAQGTWRLTETHLAVASDLAGIPLAGGRQPVLGRFPYKQEHVPAVGEYTVAIPPPDRPLARPGSGLFVSAHATVARDGMEEGAWATGTPFVPEGSPAAYFLYQPSQKTNGLSVEPARTIAPPAR